ncbi:hypothetical protein [Fructobacillus tropaeoli]|uniref:Uncharacterized protein n=1 Tax=Fructobacillus tropaeoli TaxID=709323 RepID=A0ABM9MN68_9LACO|nr:hypothetical protein R53137_KAKDMLNK_00218 [Fructobacillus tropaeoli]CAK1235335.1 hypothetical protein LMG30238_FMBOGHMB_00647 [Fructobacillus tropaeoli]
MVNKINNWTQFLNKATFNLDFGSNNYKLFDLIMSHGLDLYNNLNRQDDWIDIDNASGVALDNIGANYGEFRGEADDEFYRFMIKSNILAARSKGTTNDIIHLISKSLNVDASNVIVRPDRLYDEKTDSFVGSPYTIMIERLPLSFTTNDFQKRYLLKRIESSAAVGIRIGNISFLDYSNTSMYVNASQSVRKKYAVKNTVIGV